MAVTTEKQAIVADLKERLTTAKGAVLTSYKGLTVAQDTELRRALREAGVSYHVVKKSIACDTYYDYITFFYHIQRIDCANCICYFRFLGTEAFKIMFSYQIQRCFLHLHYI